MSRVFKCDRCGEIFKENDGAERMVEDAKEEWDEVEERMQKPYINPNAVSNHIQTIHMSNCGTVDWRNNDYDLCPSCMAKLNDWLEPNKEKQDDGNKNEWNSMTTQPQCGVAVEIEFENGDLDLAYRGYGDKRWFQNSGEWVSSDVKIVAWRYID